MTTLSKQSFLREVACKTKCVNPFVIMNSYTVQSEQIGNGENEAND